MTQKLQNFLMEKGLDAALITKPENRRYFSNFTGSAGSLLITKESKYFFADFRYTQQAENQCIGFEIIKIKDSNDIINKILELGISKLAFEDDYMDYSTYASYQEKLNGTELVPLKGECTKIRAIKTEFEITQIAKAAKIADDAFSYMLTFIKTGMTELEVALELEFFMKKQGASALSFDSIIASGVRSSLPHGVASEKVIESGDFLTMDFGCVYNGYCSDMTRTIVIGKASDEQKKIYNIVLKAEEAALEVIKPGVFTKDVDKVARDIITEAGYGDKFGHGLGHGVGLEVHESPRVAGISEEILEENMVITDEPGIYIPGFGGVRIEDLLVVTKDGYRCLSNSSKKLIEI